MATITFHATDYGAVTIQNLSGSGLGFFGAGGFGQSVAVGEYQGTTYITDSTGSNQGPAVENTKYSSAESGIQSDIGTDPVNLQSIPNRLATLNIRFSHDSDVNIQNPKVRIFDRSNINNAASGVTTKVAEIIHPETTTTDPPGGSGDGTWTTFDSDTGGNELDLVDSPGMSGINAMGSNSSSRHDWFLCLSSSPDTIGSKSNYGLYVSCEYL